jgi:hypothetical protein
MIASSSSMWQDHKHFITINYTTVADSNDAYKLNDVAAWYTDNSANQTSTKGINSPIAGKSGYVYRWRGAGWLRLITTQWEIIGLGLMPSMPDIDGTNGGHRNSDGNKDDVVVLVTFVKKTIFSPAAVSVFIQQEQLDITRRDNIVKSVMVTLRALDVESLGAEIDKLKTIS